MSLTLGDDPVAGDQGGPDGDQHGALGVVAEHVRGLAGGGFALADRGLSRVHGTCARALGVDRFRAARAGAACGRGFRGRFAGGHFAGAGFAGHFAGARFARRGGAGGAFARPFCGPLWLAVCWLWWRWWWRVACIPLSSSAAGARVSVRVVFDYPRCINRTHVCNPLREDRYRKSSTKPGIPDFSRGSRGRLCNIRNARSAQFGVSIYSPWRPDRLRSDLPAPRRGVQASLRVLWAALFAGRDRQPAVRIRSVRSARREVC